MAIPWQDHLIPNDTRDLSDYVEDATRVTATTNWMRPIGPSIWMVTDTSLLSDDASDTISRKTSCTTTIIVGLQGAGGAWIWNPGPWTQELGVELQARCGGVRHLVIPNKQCATSYLVDWSHEYPQAKVYAPPDVSVDDLPVLMDFVLTEDPKLDYVLDVDQVVFRGSHTTEVVFFHRPSETVLFADLIQPRLLEKQSWWSLIGPPSSYSSSHTTVPTEGDTNYCTPSSTRWSYWWHNEPELLRKPLDIILQKWKPAQIVLARQNEMVEEYALDVLEQVFAWVPPIEAYPDHIPFDQTLLEPFRRGVYTTGPEEQQAKGGVVKAEGILETVT